MSVSPGAWPTIPNNFGIVFPNTTEERGYDRIPSIRY